MSTTLSGRPAPALSRYRWAWYLPGLAAVGWGGYGLLTAAMGPEPLKWGLFVVACILGHDLLLAPFAVTVGRLLTRMVPPTLRAPIQVGLIGTGVAMLAGFALVIGRGTSDDVPSALPYNYAGRVAMLLGVLWVVMAGWAAFRWAAGANADQRE